MASGYSKKTLRELAGIVFSRGLAIFLIAVIITGSVVLACLMSKKTYRSQVTLWARQSKSANPLEESSDPTSRLEVFLKTQQQIILSDSVLRRVLTRLTSESLRKGPANPTGSDEWNRWSAAVDKAAESIQGKEISKFRKKIKVTTPGGEDVAKSEVFTISVDQPEPPAMAQLAAAILTEEYLDHRRQLQSQMDDSSKALLEKQLEDLRDKTLGLAEKKFNQFIQEKVKGNLLELAQFNRANGEVNHQRIRTAFEEERIKIDTEIREYEALKAEVNAQIPPKALKEGVEALKPEDLKTAGLVVPEKVITNNAVINKLKLKLADQIVDRNTLNEQYTNDFKLVTQKQGEIFRSTCDIIRELVSELKAIDQHISTLQARKKEIDFQLKEKNLVIDQLSSQYVEYESLMREVDLSRSLYDQKRKELVETDTARQMAQREVLITRVDPATLPDVDQPVRPILWLYTLIAVMVGLLLGVAWAFMADSYDHTIRTIDQAERYFGKSVLVSIPRMRGGMIQ